ncbi:MAG: hypothetical protein IJS22_04935 [Lachnospiraceae bacterium]|nr:hypothetical protein [Lachnospiraceae bacterium]
MGLILGVDICDDYSQISAFIPEKNDVEQVALPGEKMTERIPSVICKKKDADEWLIGEEAYRVALFGNGTLVDRLVKLILKKGTATIEGVKYNSEQLMTKFFGRVVELARSKYDEKSVESMVITVQEMEPRLNDILIRAAVHCGVPREKVHVYCHAECCSYYIMAQNSEIWANQVSLFDLRGTGLYYYELKVIRGRKPLVVQTTREKLEEGFSLDVLESPSGEKLADSILTACADRVLSGKLISAVLLSGKGFSTTDWAGSFLSTVCNRRRVFQTNQIFADGAAFAAGDLMRENTAFPYLFVCEGRLASTVSLFAVYGGRRESVVLSQAGTNWSEAGSSAEFIIDDLKNIELSVVPAVTGRASKILIPLDELPKRPNKTTRIEFIVSFSSEHLMTVRIIDRGFGDMFPATDKVIRQECSI